MNDLLIRPATLADIPFIYAFICDLEETRLDESAFITIFRQNILNPAIHYLVAEYGREVVGFVSCHVQSLLHHGGNVGEIQELYVHPDVRNQRIGHALLAELKELAVRERLINLEVTTNQKRVDTIRFYERESFKSTHIKLVNPIQP